MPTALPASPSVPAARRGIPWAALLRGLAFGAGFVCAVAGAVLALNTLQTRRLDPLNAPLRLELLCQAQANPADSNLVVRAREIDLLARRAFFSSQHLVRRGGWLLWIGAVLLIGALNGARWLEPSVAPPGAPAPAPDLHDREQRAARRGIIFYGGLLAAAAVAAAIALRPAPIPVEGVRGAGEPKVSVPVTAVAATDTNEPPLDHLFEQNWPAFRGPGGSGWSATPAPTRWDAGTGAGILWKVEVPRAGFSSPIVWSNRVFLTGADARRGEIFCFDADSGALVWRHEAADIPGSPETPPKTSEETGLAAATAATDGRRVYAIFANGDLVACDLDGRRVWARNLGVPKNPYGHSSSLLAVRGWLLVQYDQENGGRLLALRGADGSTVWDVLRAVKAGWSSPIAFEQDGAVRVAVLANPMLALYDLATGRDLWTLAEIEAEIGASPAWGDGRVFAGNEYTRLVAVEAASGTVLWETDEDLPDVASPLAYRGLLYLATGSGIVSCRDAAEGTKVWMQEWDEGFYSSPVAAGDVVYLTDRKGLTRAIRVGRTFELLSENPFGEEIGATPALVGGRLYLRGVRHLAAVAADAAAPAASSAAP